MGKKLYRGINYDKNGNLIIGPEVGSSYETMFDNEYASKINSIKREENIQKAVQKRAEEMRQKRHKEKLKKLQAEEEAKRKAQEKANLEAAAKREAERTKEKAKENVVVAKLNKQVEADKKKKQGEQESVWYKALAATAADLTSRVPGIGLVLYDTLRTASFAKGVLQHSGIGKIGEVDLTDISIDPVTKIKTIPDGKGGRRKLEEEEYQDIVYRDQKQYAEDQKSKDYNTGATVGTVLNTGVNVAGSLVPTVLRVGEDLFGGVSNLVRDKIAGSETAGSDFMTKMKLAKTNFAAGLAGADVELSKGLDKIIDNDYTEKRLEGHEKFYKKLSEEGDTLQREYSNNRAPYIERDIAEEKEGDPLLRQKELDSWEAGLIEEPEWHKNKEGVFSNTLGYFAKNPGRIFGYLADGVEDILREGVEERGAANNEMISAYQAYHDIKAKSLFGKEMSKTDIEDFKKNSQEVTFLTEDGQTVSVPKNRVDPRVLEENSQASPDYMNIQEVETDEQGRALIDRKTGQVKYKSKYDGMFGLEKVGKSIDLGALLDAQYVTQTVGGGVGSVGGFMIGGGGVAKAMESVSAFSKSSRALNALKTTYGAEAVEAAGLYGKAAAKLTRGAKAEDITKNVLLNYINNDSEIRTNARATREEIKDELIDRAADMYSPERVARREAILAEKGITKDHPLFEMHLQNMIREERAKYVQLNPERALTIETKAEIGAELAAQAGRMQMLTSINETLAFFTRSKMLSRAGKMSSPVMKSIRTKALEAGFEGVEETIGDYSDKYAKSAILDNTFYSVADYAKNDFVTKEGLETFSIGALMGVGQNSLAGAKKIVTKDSDNLFNRVQEYKEQKQALQNIQKLKSANSFDDVLKIYDQLNQQKEIVEISKAIDEAIERGDTNTAHKFKQEAFASHSLRMAKLGLTGEVEKNLQHLLKTPGIEGDPEAVQEITRALEVNKNIGNIYDVHTPLQNGDQLATNRVNKILAQEQIAKLQGDLDAQNPMYEEALSAYYSEKGVDTSDTSEEGKKLQEKYKQEFDNDEGSIGGVTSSVKNQVKKLEDLISNLDKNYYRTITADYQRKLRNEKQRNITRTVKKATSIEEVNEILKKFPKGETQSEELLRALALKSIKFSTEEKAKEPGFFKKVFSKKVKKKGDPKPAEEVPINPAEIQPLPEAPVQGVLDFEEEIPVVKSEEGMTLQEVIDKIEAEDKVKNSIPDGVQLELFPAEEQVQAEKKKILEGEKISEEFAEGQDPTDLPEGELTDKEGIETYNKTLETDEEISISSGTIDVSSQKDPVIDQESATAEQKIEAKKAEIVQKAEKNSRDIGISPGLEDDLKDLADKVVEATEKRDSAVKKTSNILNPEDIDYFNIQDDLNKSQEQAIKLFEVFIKQFKAKNGKKPVFQDLMEFFITIKGYSTAESVNGFFGQIWIDSAEDQDKARKEVQEAYDNLFGLNNTVNQLANLAEEVAEILTRQGEDIEKSTEAPRTTVKAQINPVVEKGEDVVTEEEVDETQDEYTEEETSNVVTNEEPGEVVPKLNPQEGIDEVVGYTESGTALVSLNTQTSAVSPSFHFSSEEYVIKGMNPDGSLIIEDKYPNTATLNRGDNDDRGGHMNIDNILNPMLAIKGAKLNIVPYQPNQELPDYDKVPFVDLDENGVRDLEVKSFQDFLNKHNIDPRKYLTPASGPESSEEQEKRKLFISNAPMHVTVEHNGVYHQLGTVIPTINQINKSNTGPKGDSDAAKREQERNIEIKRNTLYKQRELIFSGHSEFKVTDRTVNFFKTYELLDDTSEGRRYTKQGDKMTLSKAHPTESLVVIFDKVLENPTTKKKTVSFHTDKKNGRKIPLSESHKDIVLDEKSVENFLRANAGRDMRGWSVALILKNTEVDSEGNVKRIYGITQTVNNANQEVQKQANDSKLVMTRLKAYYRVKELIRKERVTSENLEAFYKEKINSGELTPSIVQDYRKISSSDTLTKNADKIISRLSSKFRVSFMGLSLNSKGVLVNSSTDNILDGFPLKYQDEFTVKYSLNKKDGVLPIIDLENGTVEDYKSAITGRTGYNAFFEDSVGNRNMGFQIHDVTSGKDITVFAPQPIITFAPVNVQERRETPAESKASTSSILQQKLAEKRKVEEKKNQTQGEEVSEQEKQEIPSTTPPGLSIEQEIQNILDSEVKYLDENGEEC